VNPSRRSLVLLVIGVLALARTARAAEPTSDEDPRILQAFRTCQTGQAAAGVDLLNQLYADTLDPQYVVAQGRCWQRNGKPREAMRAYREYLRVAPTAPDDERARVEQYLKEAQAEAEAAPIVVPPPVVVAPPRPSPPLTLIAPAPARTPDEGGRPLYKRWPFWAVVGGVLAGGVVTALVLANRGGAPSASCPAGVTCMHF
jgi:hypothetical protein